MKMSILWALAALLLLPACGPTDDSGTPGDDDDDTVIDPTPTGNATVTVLVTRGDGVEDNSCHAEFATTSGSPYQVDAGVQSEIPAPASYTLRVGDPTDANDDGYYRSTDEFGRWWIAEPESVALNADETKEIPVAQNRDLDAMYYCYRNDCEWDSSKPNNQGPCEDKRSSEMEQRIRVVDGMFLEGEDTNGFAGAGWDSDVWIVVGNTLELSSTELPEQYIANAMIDDDDSFSYTVYNTIDEQVANVICEPM